VNTTYYIEIIGFRICEKIFKHQYGRSPYNVALFLIFAQNTSTVRTNLTNKRIVLRIQEIAFQGFNFKFSGGRSAPDSCSNAPPLENLHPLQQIRPDLSLESKAV
jgi:hypothetical protein